VAVGVAVAEGISVGVLVDVTVTVDVIVLRTVTVPPAIVIVDSAAGVSVPFPPVAITGEGGVAVNVISTDVGETAFVILITTATGGITGAAVTFVGGGVAHGPKPRSYKKRMPKKMRRLALRSALSVKASANQIVVLDDLQFQAPKTREALEVLDNLQIDGSAVVLLAERNENVEKSIRNLSDVKYLRAGYLNVRDLLGFDYVIMPKASVEVIESFLG
jgi:hypothetical protein